MHMRTQRRTTILLGGLLSLAVAACSPSRPDAASSTAAAAGGVGAGVTSTPVQQVAKFDYGTQYSAQTGQLQWSNAATGVPMATAEYACGGQTVAIDSTAGFHAEQAGSCPDGKPFYKYTW